jgi:hypothetical protein
VTYTALWTLKELVPVVTTKSERSSSPHNLYIVKSRPKNCPQANIPAHLCGRINYLRPAMILLRAELRQLRDAEVLLHESVNSRRVSPSLRCKYPHPHSPRCLIDHQRIRSKTFQGSNEALRVNRVLKLKIDLIVRHQHTNFHRSAALATIAVADRKCV